MAARLRTDFWVSALRRRAEAAGAFTSIARRGAEEAGSVFVLVDHRDGRFDLYRPAPQSVFGDDAHTDRLFSRIAQGVSEEAARLRMVRRSTSIPTFGWSTLRTGRGAPSLKLLPKSRRRTTPASRPVNHHTFRSANRANTEMKWLRSSLREKRVEPAERDAARQRRDRHLSWRSRRVSRPAPKPAGEAAPASGQARRRVGRINRLMLKPGEPKAPADIPPAASTLRASSCAERVGANSRNTAMMSSDGLSAMMVCSTSSEGARFSFALCAASTTIMSSRPSRAVRSFRLKTMAPVGS